MWFVASLFGLAIIALAVWYIVGRHTLGVAYDGYGPLIVHALPTRYALYRYYNGVWHDSMRFRPASKRLQKRLNREYAKASQGPVKVWTRADVRGFLAYAD